MAGYEPLALQRAKRMRREPTDVEKRLWSALRGGRIDGWKFRRQQPIGNFIADFVCQTARLVVEVDGSQHADSTSDARRDAWLEQAGYRIFRVWNNDVMHNIEGIVMAIAVELAATPSPSPTRPSGQGRTPKSPYPLPPGERSDPYLEGPSRT